MAGDFSASTKDAKGEVTEIDDWHVTKQYNKTRTETVTRQEKKTITAGGDLPPGQYCRDFSKTINYSQPWCDYTVTQYAVVKTKSWWWYAGVGLLVVGGVALVVATGGLAAAAAAGAANALAVTTAVTTAAGVATTVTVSTALGTTLFVGGSAAVGAGLTMVFGIPEGYEKGGVIGSFLTSAASGPEVVTGTTPETMTRDWYLC